MYLKGPVLILFSAGCIGLAGLAHHAEQRKGMSQGLTQLAQRHDCAADGFDTAAGRITCVTPVSFPFITDLLDERPF